MMELYQMIAYLVTNGIRMFSCLLAVTILLKSEKISKNMVWLSLICSTGTAVLCSFQLQRIGIIVFEALAVIFILYWKYDCEIKRSVFPVFCYEIAVAQWDFLFSAVVKISFQYSTINTALTKYMIAVWLVRLLLIGLSVFLLKGKDKAVNALNRLIAMIAAIGLFAVILLGEQSSAMLPEGEFTTWVILSIIFMIAVWFYKLNSKYEVEKEIVRLKTEQMEQMEYDYKSMSNAYSANAKLYHDLHNHLEILYSYIRNGESKNALRYIEDLRAPVEKVTKNVWTGDEAVDYLISSKIAVLEQHGVETKVNIEFPRNTNIRTADLTAILGNLLDNALEAIINSTHSDHVSHFLYLAMRRINDMLIIKVENSCVRRPDISGREARTTKSDKELHGWGLKSARNAAEKYDGTLEISYDKISEETGVFRVVVTLSFEAV